MTERPNEAARTKRTRQTQSEMRAEADERERDELRRILDEDQMGLFDARVGHGLLEVGGNGDRIWKRRGRGGEG